MGWLNLRLKEAESDFDFCQLSESGSVTLDRSGLVAVFTPEHARDHATGANKGTMRNPNMRMREDLTRFQTAPASPSSTTTHGGYPTPGAPTVPTTTVKPPTMLQNALGELADGYKLSAESIEKADLNYLNFFLEGIGNARMSDMWKKKSDRSGRKFVVTMLAEMRKSGSSLTSEDTIDTRMRLVITNGLLDPTFNSFLDAMGEYEDLNNVRANPIDERQRAHTYKKMICDVSKEIEMKFLLRLSILESAAAAIGENPARDSPIEHVTEAANIVLDDQLNIEMCKAIDSGRAFNAGGFDPARNQRRPPGGQTWSSNGPDEHIAGMRNCVFCNDRSIPDAQKQHVDLKCTFASKSQKDALVKERKDRAESKRKAWQDRSKNKGKGTTGGGGAALAKATAAKAVDDADEAAARDIFNTGSPVLLDLDDLMPQGAGRSFMAKPSPLAHAPPSLVASNGTKSSLLPVAPSRKSPEHLEGGVDHGDDDDGRQPVRQDHICTRTHRRHPPGLDLGGRLRRRLEDRGLPRDRSASQPRPTHLRQDQTQAPHDSRALLRGRTREV